MRETASRIHRSALLLSRDHGLDGWTMDELADSAEVSRRTLFNYVPGKIDAVIGAIPELPDDLVVAFVAGGPSGRLLDDLAVLAHAVLEEKDFDRDTVALRRQVMTAIPRLLPILHERVESLFAEGVDAILAREGTEFGRRRADLVIRVLVSLVDAAILAMLAEDPDPGPRPLAEVFDETLRDARALFA